MKFERYLIVFMVLVVTVALSSVIPPFYAAVVIPAVCVATYLMGKPRVFIYTYLIVAAIFPLLKSTIPFKPIGYLNEMMALVLLVVFIGYLCLGNMNLKIIRKNKFGFGPMMLFTALPLVVFRGSIKVTAQGMLLYFSFIAVYILSVNFLTRRDLKVMLKGSVGLFWVSFILNMGWHLRINPLYNSSVAEGMMVDASKGTMGSCSVFAYYCIMLFFILLTFRVKDVAVLGRRTKRIIDSTLVALFVQLYFTFTNHAYIYFVLCSIPFLIITGFWKRRQVVIGGVLLVLAAAGAYLGTEYFQKIFSEENLRYRYEKALVSPKMLLFGDLLVENVKDNPVEWVIGVGPGNGMGSVGKDNRTPFALRMLLEYYTSQDFRIRTAGVDIGSITGSTQSSILTLWGDFGLVGFLIFIMIYVRLFMLLVKKALSSTGEIQCLALGMIGALSMYALTSVTYDMMMLPFFPCWLWMFAALLTLPEDQVGAE